MECQFSPSFTPINVKKVDQINDPANVKIENLNTFISATPAGREINVLTAGKSRDVNAINWPYFRNQLSPFS